ncbi:MAG TPA: hypothetical protein VFF36_10040 [Planctomycetota bacterium]|nr:hypothetical protein [Planctomycetota bacterium]
MDVVDALRAHPAQQQAGLGQIGQVAQQALGRLPAHRHGGAQGAQRAQRVPQRHRGSRRQHGANAAIEQDTRPLQLGAVAPVDELLARPAHRDPEHLDPGLLDAGDLAPDEGMAHLRILAGEVADLHERPFAGARRR